MTEAMAAAIAGAIRELLPEVSAHVAGELIRNVAERMRNTVEDGAAADAGAWARAVAHWHGEGKA